MGTNHGGGVNFGRRLPPIGGQYSTPINTLLWTACSRPAAPPKWCSRLLGRLRPPQSPRCDYRPRPAIRSMLSVCMTITATAASPAARRGATASRQCRAAIPPTASCATATAMASSANRQVPAHRLRRRPGAAALTSHPEYRRYRAVVRMRPALRGLPEGTGHQHRFRALARNHVVDERREAGIAAERNARGQQAQRRRGRRQQMPRPVAG